VADAIRDIGPLGGIYSGLLASDQERNLVVACDMPSVKAELVQYLCSFNEGQAIVAKTNGLPQPLLGVYNRNCLSSIKEHIYRKDYKLSSLLQDIDTRYVEEDELKKIDPGLVSFRNINTKEEMYDQ
ncbi:MAG: molybdenum cofactor guanylyltransferase, partial [Candidatus Margulisiibacteriota bacterium]